MLFSIAVLACNQPPPKTDDSAAKSAEAKALYEKNLSALKTMLKAFADEQIDACMAGVDDKVVWNSAAYGSQPGTKEDWKKVLTSYIDNWDSLQLVNPSFLPGIDSATQEPDGSVRYYGKWNGVHKSGLKTSVNFYATIEFNSENKIIEQSDFFDIGGLINAVSAKKK